MVYSLDAAELDAAKLPPPSTVKIEFDRDIRPIFEKSCWRCHGSEKPKSHFRLDNREGALKGGDNGIDLVPGESAKSPLIHYVAGLVPDLEMPPPGKGEPLTASQVGLLRAWIDQGLPWVTSNAVPPLALSTAPSFRWVGVKGDAHKFREIEGFKEGFGGGLEHFSLQEQIEADKKVSLEGHVLLPEEDIQLKLALDKTDFGFVHAGFEQWRKYYDDSGGYYRPFSPPSFDLDRDLHLDIGRAWIDFGLTLPRWPQIVAGYEYQFKDGEKSTLAWGNVGGKNIYPAVKAIDEQVHVVKLDLTHDLYEWRLEDSARIEFYKANTRQDTVATNSGSFTTGPMPDKTVRTSEGFNHVEGMNTARVERQVTDWWLLSGGYLYSRLEGGASLDQVTVNAFGQPVAGMFWSADDVTLKRQSHILSLGNLFLPADYLSASLGVQSEWTHQEGFGNVHLDEADPNVPLVTAYPATVQSDLDKQELSENCLIRLTKIPSTVVFAEGRFAQESIGQFEQDEPEAGTSPDPKTTFLRNTDFTNDRREWRTGFDTSPWRWLAFNAHFKSRSSDSEYENSKIALKDGYPAFIRARKIDTDEVQTKLVLRPVNWLKTTLTYQLISTDYSTSTDPVQGITPGGPILAGQYEANVFGLQATVTPIQRFYFSGTITYSDSRTLTAQNGNPSVVPYKGGIYSLMTSGTYLLSQTADLHASYSFSRADYGQSNFADGLPLGLDFTRHALMIGFTCRLTSYLNSSLRYGFYQYNEPSSGQVNNYTAHGIFATCSFTWP